MAPTGHTRTAVHRDHAVITPDGHVRAAPPGWVVTDAIVLISPRMGAGFSQWIAEMHAGGTSAAPVAGAERFVFVTDGAVALTCDGSDEQLRPGGYAFVPAGVAHTITASEASVLTVIEKPFVALPGQEPPAPIVGREQDAPGAPLQGDEDLLVRTLLPDDPRYDMAVNTMTYAPGAALPFVETHVMEHGLQMLAGSMVYRLGGRWYTVERGDTIYMAAHCPQWAAAYGKTPAKYLIYKDWNRDALASP